MKFIQMLSMLLEGGNISIPGVIHGNQETTPGESNRDITPGINAQTFRLSNQKAKYTLLKTTVEKVFTEINNKFKEYCNTDDTKKFNTIIPIDPNEKNKENDEDNNINVDDIKTLILQDGLGGITREWWSGSTELIRAEINDQQLQRFLFVKRQVGDVDRKINKILKTPLTNYLLHQAGKDFPVSGLYVKFINYNKKFIIPYTNDINLKNAGVEDLIINTKTFKKLSGVRWGADAVFFNDGSTIERKKIIFLRKWIRKEGSEYFKILGNEILPRKGRVAFIGFSPSGTQHITLWNIPFNPTARKIDQKRLNIQIDFEFKDLDGLKNNPKATEGRLSDLAQRVDDADSIPELEKGMIHLSDKPYEKQYHYKYSNSEFKKFSLLNKNNEDFAKFLEKRNATYINFPGFLKAQILENHGDIEMLKKIQYIKSSGLNKIKLNKDIDNTKDFETIEPPWKKYTVGVDAGGSRERYVKLSTTLSDDLTQILGKENIIKALQKQKIIFLDLTELKNFLNLKAQKLNQEKIDEIASKVFPRVNDISELAQKEGRNDRGQNFKSFVKLIDSDYIEPLKKDPNNKKIKLKFISLIEKINAKSIQRGQPELSLEKKLPALIYIKANLDKPDSHNYLQIEPKWVAEALMYLFVCGELQKIQSDIIKSDYSKITMDIIEKYLKNIFDRFSKQYKFTKTDFKWQNFENIKKYIKNEDIKIKEEDIADLLKDMDDASNKKLLDLFPEFKIKD